MGFLPLNDVVGKHEGDSTSPPLAGSTGVKLYQTSRLLSRDFYRMINRRRKALVFKDADITERAFFDLMSKASGGGPPTVSGRSPLVSTWSKIQ